MTCVWRTVLCSACCSFYAAASLLHEVVQLPRSLVPSCVAMELLPSKRGHLGGRSMLSPCPALFFVAGDAMVGDLGGERLLGSLPLSSNCFT